MTPPPSPPRVAEMRVAWALPQLTPPTCAASSPRAARTMLW